MFRSTLLKARDLELNSANVSYVGQSVVFQVNSENLPSLVFYHSLNLRFTNGVAAAYPSVQFMGDYRYSLAIPSSRSLPNFRAGPASAGK
jgi:hypothetical protein